MAEESGGGGCCAGDRFSVKQLPRNILERRRSIGVISRRYQQAKCSFTVRYLGIGEAREEKILVLGNTKLTTKESSSNTKHHVTYVKMKRLLVAATAIEFSLGCQEAWRIFLVKSIDSTLTSLLPFLLLTRGTILFLADPTRLALNADLSA